MSSPQNLSDFIAESEAKEYARSNALICLRIGSVIGSAPREVGTFMLVSKSGLFKTIGGGQMEQSAIDRARAMLKEAETGDKKTPLKAETMSFSLNPKLGQCCGGRVEIELLPLDERLKAELLEQDAHARTLYPSLYIFGAGHVGRALVAILDGLPFHLHLVDSRAEQLALCPDSIQNLTKHLTPLPESLVKTAPAGASFVIATHEHSLDFMIVAEVLARDFQARVRAPYLGMIGSRAKRKQFDAWLTAQGTGLPDGLQSASLVCPIGAAGLGDKRPFAIALHTASEILAAQKGF